MQLLLPSHRHFYSCPIRFPLTMQLHDSTAAVYGYASFRLQARLRTSSI